MNHNKNNNNLRFFGWVWNEEIQALSSISSRLLEKGTHNNMLWENHPLIIPWSSYNICAQVDEAIDICISCLML